MREARFRERYKHTRDRRKRLYETHAFAKSTTSLTTNNGTFGGNGVLRNGRIVILDMSTAIARYVDSGSGACEEDGKRWIHGVFVPLRAPAPNGERGMHVAREKTYTQHVTCI